MRSQINIEIDEKPLLLCPPTQADYISRQLCGALYRNLLRWDANSNSPLPDIIAEWTHSPDHILWMFRVREDIFWSDGTQLSADDVLRGFFSAKDHLIWGRYLSVIKVVEVLESHLVRIKLRRPFSPLLALLSTVDLSPRPPKSIGNSVWNGFYCVDKIDPGYLYSLFPNQAIANYKLLPKLQFIVNRIPEASIEGFANGDLDVTSPTGFPHTKLEEWHRKIEFRSGDTGIFMQLEPNPSTQSRINPMVRHALFLALDRAVIAHELGDVISPSRHFGPQTMRLLANLRLPTTNQNLARAVLRESGLNVTTLCIHYNDYYPNRQILEIISEQWRSELDISTTLVPVDFIKSNSTGFDFLLTLRFPTFPSEWAVLDHFAMLATATGAKQAEEIRRLLRDWGSDGLNMASLPLLRSLLVAAMPVLPLFDVIGHWLQKTWVYGFEYPTNGCFDYSKLYLCNEKSG